MRILYIAPRYHTNQIPIMKGLREHGDEIYFFSHYAGKIEDYTYVTPEIIGYSPLYKIYDHIYKKWLHPDDPMAMDRKLLRGFPPVFKLSRRMKEAAPDLVIMRERSAYSIVAYLLCKLHHFKAILYNQSPLWIEKRDDISHKIVDKLTPKVRMTPVRGNASQGLVRDKNAYFVPFVMEVSREPEQRSYLKDGVIHIFTVGKYEKRKNLQMMLEVFERLAPGYPVQLSIAGECTTKAHQAVYEKLENYIQDHKIQNVFLFKNLKRQEMEQQYAKADLFVIPSTGEPASISQLEAMAFSIPVICSDTNGTACYVENGINGYQFADQNADSLQSCIELFLKDSSKLSVMGRNSCQYLKQNCQFQNYYAGIMECYGILCKKLQR